MKIPKRLFAFPVLLFILMMFLSGCGTHYEKLSTEGKEAVERIMESKHEWLSEDCDSIWFENQDEEKVFCVKELDRHYSNPSMDQYAFNYYYYSFDNSIQKIGSDWKSGVYYSFGNSKRYTYNPTWKKSWTESEQRSYIAEMYSKAFGK